MVSGFPSTAEMESDATLAVFSGTDTEVGPLLVGDVFSAIFEIALGLRPSIF